MRHAVPYRIPASFVLRTVMFLSLMWHCVPGVSQTMRTERYQAKALLKIEPAGVGVIEVRSLRVDAVTLQAQEIFKRLWSEQEGEVEVPAMASFEIRGFLVDPTVVQVLAEGAPPKVVTLTANAVAEAALEVAREHAKKTAAGNVAGLQKLLTHQKHALEKQVEKVSALKADGADPAELQTAMEQQATLENAIAKLTEYLGIANQRVDQKDLVLKISEPATKAEKITAP